MKSVYFLTSAEKCSTEYPLTPFLHGLFADYGKKMQWKICRLCSFGLGMSVLMIKDGSRLSIILVGFPFSVEMIPFFS